MHFVCTFSEDNDLKILNSDVDAVFFADAEMKFLKSVTLITLDLKGFP